VYLAGYTYSLPIPPYTWPDIQSLHTATNRRLLSPTSSRINFSYAKTKTLCAKILYRFTSKNIFGLTKYLISK